MRPVAAMLRQILALSDRPLTEAREPKQSCGCRHFATMLCGVLREQGVPARARCGFGPWTSTRGRFEDHWVAEYWNSAQISLDSVDAQLDGVQRKTFKPDFDPLDVPRDRFILAGDAWRQCRDGQANPNLFGLSIYQRAGVVVGRPKPHPRFGRSQSNGNAALGRVGSDAKTHNRDHRP